MRTDRLTLRPLSMADPDALLAGLDDPEVARWLGRVPHPYTRADALDIIARRQAEPAPVWTIYDDNGLAGGIGLDRHLGYWLASRAWGLGYATEAARIVVSAHFADPAAETLESSYFEGNSASARVLSKLGFRHAGPRKIASVSLGREVDGHRMLLSRADHARQPLFTLQTQRLRLDKLQAADWPVVQAEWGDPRVARMTATLKSNWTPVEARDWIEARAVQGRDGFGLAVRLRDGTLIGSVGIGGSPCNLGYALGVRHWGRGYATEAVGAFLRAAYRCLPELDELTAGVFDDNPASARVLSKLGFSAVGPGDCSSLARLEPAANTQYRLTRSSLKV